MITGNSQGICTKQNADKISRRLSYFIMITKMCHLTWRKRNRLATLPYSWHQRWLRQDLMREMGTTGYAAFRIFNQDPTNRALKNNSATLVNFMLCCQKIFVPLKFMRFLQIKLFA